MQITSLLSGISTKRWAPPRQGTCLFHSGIHSNLDSVTLHIMKNPFVSVLFFFFCLKPPPPPSEEEPEERKMAAAASTRGAAGPLRGA